MVTAGLIIAAIGLFVPIPGPLDDPVDFLGYLITLLGIVKNLLSNR